MRQYTQFYINGQWVSPSNAPVCDVINPATEQVVAQISLGTQADVDAAVAAAKAAFTDFSCSPVEDRIALLERILSIYQ